MSEENKNLTNESGENNAPENNNSKKKKAIIIGAVIVAIAVIIAVVACVSSGKKENESTPADEGVSEIIVISPNGEGGNANGTDNANQSNGEAGGSSSQGTASQGGNSQGGSSSQGNGSQGGNSQAGAGSSNEQTTPGETTTIPKSRYIYINVLVPENNRTTDKLEFFINGESIGTQDVDVDGELHGFQTPDKYEGDVTVEVKILRYGTSATGTVADGSDTVEIRLPLNRAEENLGDNF
ncbi:MAG: hypothetical protein MR619_03145 [Eubacterium sp.]|nr:hypothetical protein [Eubacterium sp.]